MASGYAKQTAISASGSIAEIQRTVERFGADAFAFSQHAKGGTIGFRFHNRTVRFDVELPDRNAPCFTETEGGQHRSPRKRKPEAALKEWEAACRSKWRSLALLIKALVVAIEDGLIDFDRAFMHDIVMPNGRTVGSTLLPDVQRMVESGKQSPLFLEAKP